MEGCGAVRAGRTATRSDPYRVARFEDDPDGEEGRAGDGWYFAIRGRRGWNGPWDAEEEAERLAIAEIGDRLVEAEADVRRAGPTAGGGSGEARNARRRLRRAREAVEEAASWYAAEGGEGSRT